MVRTPNRKSTAFEQVFVEAFLKLLPMLMLARVDGKSPVEYTTPVEKEFIRSFVYAELRDPSRDFKRFTEKWKIKMKAEFA